MTSTLQGPETFRIHVTAAAPAAPLAILSIAGILGIEPQQVAERLATLPTVLADDVAPPVARRLSGLLPAFGLQVRLDPVSSPPTAEAAFDVALQPTAGVGPGLIERVAACLALPEPLVAAGLRRPGGLVLHGLSADRADALRAALRRDKAVRVLRSFAPTAVYDAWRRAGAVTPASDLIRLGLSGDRVTGAVAVGMNAPTARHVARRLGGALQIVNRDFQRFDLHFVAAPGLDGDEVERFLARRNGAAEAGGQAGVIDRDLSFRAMRQFAKDYAAIGVVVRAELCGRNRPTAQSR